MPRPVPAAMFMSLMLDQPLSPACLADYGVNTEEHHRVLQNMVRQGKIDAEGLDEIYGDGPAITAKANETNSNPRGVVFETVWDDLPEPE